MSSWETPLPAEVPLVLTRAQYDQARKRWFRWVGSAARAVGAPSDQESWPKVCPPGSFVVRRVTRWQAPTMVSGVWLPGTTPTGTSEYMPFFEAPELDYCLDPSLYYFQPAYESIPPAPPATITRSVLVSGPAPATPIGGGGPAGGFAPAFTLSPDIARAIALSVIENWPTSGGVPGTTIDQWRLVAEGKAHWENVTEPNPEYEAWRQRYAEQLTQRGLIGVNDRPAFSGSVEQPMISGGTISIPKLDLSAVEWAIADSDPLNPAVFVQRRTPETRDPRSDEWWYDTPFGRELIQFDPQLYFWAGEGRIYPTALLALPDGAEDTVLVRYPHPYLPDEAVPWAGPPVDLAVQDKEYLPVQTIRVAPIRSRYISIPVVESEHRNVADVRRLDAGWVAYFKHKGNPSGWVRVGRPALTAAGVFLGSLALTIVSAGLAAGALPGAVGLAAGALPAAAGAAAIGATTLPLAHSIIQAADAREAQHAQERVMRAAASRQAEQVAWQQAAERAQAEEVARLQLQAEMWTAPSAAQVPVAAGTDWWALLKIGLALAALSR